MKFRSILVLLVRTHQRPEMAETLKSCYCTHGLKSAVAVETIFLFGCNFLRQMNFISKLSEVKRSGSTLLFSKLLLLPAPPEVLRFRFRFRLISLKFFRFLTNLTSFLNFADYCNINYIGSFNLTEFAHTANNHCLSM